MDIKNRTYYFYDDIIDLESFKSNLLKIDKKSYKDIGIYNIRYKIIGDCENTYSVNLLYLCITHASGCNECNSVEETNENKYLILTL